MHEIIMLITFGAHIHIFEVKILMLDIKWLYNPFPPSFSSTNVLTIEPWIVSIFFTWSDLSYTHFFYYLFLEPYFIHCLLSSILILDIDDQSVTYVCAYKDTQTMYLSINPWLHQGIQPIKKMHLKINLTKLNSSKCFWGRF